MNVLPVLGSVVPLVLAAAAWRCSRARRLRQSVDDLLVAELELRGQAEPVIATVLAARAAEILATDDAAVYRIDGTTAVLIGATHDAADRLSFRESPEIFEALRTPVRVRHGRVVIPLHGGHRFSGVLIVALGHRRVDRFTMLMIRLLGWTGAAAFERCSIGDSRRLSLADPSAAAAAMSSLGLGDAMALVHLEPAESLVASGDAAIDIALDRAALSMWQEIRNDDVLARLGRYEFVIIYRDVRAAIDEVVSKVIRSCHERQPDCRVSVGTALHLPGSPPMTTGQRAREALTIAQQTGSHLVVAPDLTAALS